MEDIFSEANKVYSENFQPETWFERAIFYSWYCDIHDCAFCYMSSKPALKNAVRRTESILAELLICKLLGWKIGFISGGVGAIEEKRFLELLKAVHPIAGKVWLNIGAVGKSTLNDYATYCEGVVASVETINPALHSKLCPSKPLKPYEAMLENARKIGLKTGITIIIGLGETHSDYELLRQFITKYGVSKIHYYSLNPQKGTIFQDSLPPTKEDQAWWIARTRIDFPKMDIQAGIWADRVDRVAFLLSAGANSISKFPAIRKFGSKEALEIEKQAKIAGREFIGSLTKLPVTEIETLFQYVPEERLSRVKTCLKMYLSKISHQKPLNKPGF